MAERMSDQKKNHSDIYQRVLQQKKELRSLSHDLEQCPTPDEIDEVIVIMGSSRSGSSLLYYLLSQHPDLISLQGEEVVFTKLYGLNTISSFNDSDCLDKNIKVNLNELAQEMLCDGGHQDASLLRPSSRLIHDRAQRLLIQWPHIQFDLNDLLKACSLEKWEDVIKTLNVRWPEITLGRYDRFANGNKNVEPGFFIEEPPFIVPTLKTYKPKSQKKILLLKSSINAFRSELIPSLFPKAQLKYIHLTRHPAASINGLMDGWCSDAFHTHHLGHLTTLKIDGYDSPAWWKFDLPPGWSEYTHKPLAEVCAFQWRASNEAILSALKRKDPVVIKYEDLLTFTDLVRSLKTICQKLQLSDDFLETLSPPPAIMSVNTPDQFRWKEKEHLIAPILATKEIKHLAEVLGHTVDV